MFIGNPPAPAKKGNKNCFRAYFHERLGNVDAQEAHIEDKGENSNSSYDPLPRKYADEDNGHLHESGAPDVIRHKANSRPDAWVRRNRFGESVCMPVLSARAIPLL